MNTSDFMKTIDIDSEVINDRFRYIFEQDLIDELLMSKRMYHFENESMIMDIGDVINHIPLLINGSIKVMRQDEWRNGWQSMRHGADLFLIVFKSVLMNY